MQSLLGQIKKHLPFYAFGVYFLTYSLLVLLPAPVHETLVKYHLSSVSYRWLELSVTLPSILTWFITLYGFDRLRKYGYLIKDSKDGKSILTISNGLGVIAYGTPLVGIVNTISALMIRNHTNLLSTQTIVRNYLLMLVPLIAFILINQGTRGLSELIKSRPSRAAGQILVIMFIIIGVAYCYLVLKNIDSPLNKANTPQAYYLPDILILATLVVPYLYIWFTGMLSVTEILLYNQKIKGIIYKRSWMYISRGFIGVITASIVIQYLTSLSGKLNRLHLNSLLALVYALLILQALGYVFIALGAKKLQKIEEV
jgi:hypothetical protein